MAHRDLVLLGVPLAAVGAWAAWHGRDTRFTDEKAMPAQSELAAAAGVSPTTLIVDFRDDVSAAALLGNAYDEQPISDYSARDRLYRIELGDAATAAVARVALAGDPNVETVDADVPASIPPDEAALAEPAAEAECARTSAEGGAPGAASVGFPNDPCFRYQWHMSQIGLPAAWKLGQAEGVVVAVIDTGVSRVPDLAGVELVKGYNFVANNNRAEDDHGHGTHVAGTIAQATHNGLGVSGVAFKAKIMPLKVLASNGAGSMAAIAQAIRYAADNGARVINMSLGGPFPVGTIGKAVAYARARGVTVVAAAGNDGRGKVSYPARYPGVLAVAATQFDETTTFYSNWGPQIDVAAPGGNVRVDQNGDGKPDGVLQNTVVPGDITRTDYLWFMGTSMASPHVAGVAALVVGAGITRPEAVEQIVLDTARRPRNPGKSKADGSPGRMRGRVDDHYGAGIVDSGEALKKARRGRGAGELGLGAALALTALTRLRRRGRLETPGRAGWLGLVVALGLAGSHGFVGLGATLFGAGAQGHPLVWSALPLLVLVALFYGVRRARPALAGFAFGLGGALLFAAVADTIDVRYLPDAVDRPWLLAQAVAAALVGATVLRR